MYRSTGTTLAGIPRIQDGILAAQGGWTKATPLPADINVIVAVENPNSGVRLVPARAGMGQMVVNTTNSTVRVFPYTTTDRIGTGNAGASFDLPPNSGADFTCVRDGQWGVLPGMNMVVPKATLKDGSDAPPVVVSGYIDDPLYAPGEEPPPEPVPPMLWEYPPPDEPPPAEPPVEEPAPTP